MKKGRDGYSLLEAMVGLALFLMVLTMTVALLREYGRINSFDSRHSHLVGAGQKALRQMASESLSALNFNSPGQTNLSAPKLAFSRLRYDAVDRLPVPVPDSEVTDWNIRLGSHLEQVEYRYEQGRLYRRGRGREDRIAQELSGFEARFLSPRRLSLKVSVMSESRLLSTSLEQYLPQELQP